MSDTTSAVQFTDRYDALGIKPPLVLTVCRGQCEGTGAVPVFVDSEARRAERKRRGRTRCIIEDEPDPRLRALWEQAEAEDPADDGWHFVRCPACEGTGRQRGPFLWVLAKNLPRVLKQKARFARFHLFSTATWRKDVPHPVWFNVRLVIRILLTSW
ncbi:hypothetical protein ACQP25_44730 (plasmid) [Microtetraspora malaysiensis]|uniref:hypothetical protein n=1 Tax=Microtetraspora malaysiensis TaxID=161358 RepID=UPI003D8FF9C4